MTVLVNLNQKMPSFIDFREILGLRRVITRFDSLLFPKHYRKGGIL
jgi:hypothetical protein